jgi:hypothetical protein
MKVSGQLHSPVVITPSGTAPGTQWIEGWWGPGAGSDTGEKSRTPAGN